MSESEEVIPETVSESESTPPNDCSFLRITPAPNFVLVRCEIPTKRVLGSTLGLEAGTNPMKDEDLRRAIVLAVGCNVRSLVAGDHCYLPINRGLQVEKFYRLNKPGQDALGQTFMVKEDDIWGKFQYVDETAETGALDVIRGLLTKELEDLQIKDAEMQTKRIEARNNPSPVARIQTYRDIPRESR